MAPQSGRFDGKKFLLVTLGCFRNEVESDLLRSSLASLGLEETGSPESCDIAFVMTCGFIRESCDEGIDTLLELDGVLSRRTFRPPMLAVGCMAQRYGTGLLAEMPELSGVLGVDWASGLAEALEGALDGTTFGREPGYPSMARVSRLVDSSPNATLYVRVADGCDRACAFCAIPSIKGPLVSRPISEVLAEVEALCTDRDREVILLAQDLTSYGRDLGPEDLADLLFSLARIEHVRWIRMLYLQPEGVTGRLIEAVATLGCVCDYFDIPFQHASAPVLARMGRPGSAQEYLDLLARIREAVPGAALRSTVMVGYPGETEADFEALLEFVREARFDWLGAFMFSPEEGTAAAALGPSVSQEEAVWRYNEVVALQDDLEALKAEQMLGRRLVVVVDDLSPVEPYSVVGRSYREAPVVDGAVYLERGRDGPEALPGDFLEVTVVGNEGLDLVAET